MRAVPSPELARAPCPLPITAPFLLRTLATMAGETTSYNLPWFVRRMGSKRAHELGVAFGKNPLAVPHAVLQVKIAEARPIAPASELIALGEKIPIRVGIHHHRANADLVEQRPLREREIVFTATRAKASSRWARYCSGDRSSTAIQSNAIPSPARAGG